MRIAIGSVLAATVCMMILGCAAGGSYTNSDGGSSGASGAATHSAKQVCPACDGSGVCNMCYGDGRNPLDSNHALPCVTCHGGGRCSRCHGSGSI
jgi:hypothetical protein